MTVKYAKVFLAVGAIASTILALQRDASASDTTIWSGVYTEEQAQRGKKVHAALCTRCHGPRLDGAGQSDMPNSPAIARDPLLRKWDGQPIAALYVLTKATMPPTAAGALSDQEYMDAVAYILKMSRAPTGTAELVPESEALNSIMITLPPER